MDCEREAALRTLNRQGYDPVTVWRMRQALKLRPLVKILKGHIPLAHHTTDLNRTDLTAAIQIFTDFEILNSVILYHTHLDRVSLHINLHSGRSFTISVPSEMGRLRPLHAAARIALDLHCAVKAPTTEFRMDSYE